MVSESYCEDVEESMITTATSKQWGSLNISCNIFDYEIIITLNIEIPKMAKDKNNAAAVTTTKLMLYFGLSIQLVTPQS